MTAKRATTSTHLLVLLALTGACGRGAFGISVHRDSGSDTQGGSPDVEESLVTTQPPMAGQCPDGFSPCGKGDGLRCYDLSQSKAHCGACGHVCAPGIACQAGTCQQYRCKGSLSFKALSSSDGYPQLLGDFDGDGTLDIVGTPVSGTSMSLLYGAGDGTFATHQDIDLAAMPGWQAVAADVDGDGLLDIASIDSGWISPPGTKAVAVSRGSGNRMAPFGGAVVYTARDYPARLLLADFDADGRIDMVVGLDKALEYWRGQDGGRFEYQATYDSEDHMFDFSGGPTALAMDWNGDGILDLVYPVGGKLHFRLGRGDSSFDPEVACALGMSAIGDLDHDHRPDLITGSNLLLGIDSCHANKIVTLPDWPKQGGVGMADFNGDGNLDIVADYDKNVTVRVGDGQGGFVQSLSMAAYQAGQWPIGMFLSGDLNDDGKLDLIFARDNKWGVFLNTCQ